MAAGASRRSRSSHNRFSRQQHDAQKAEERDPQVHVLLGSAGLVEVVADVFVNRLHRRRRGVIRPVGRDVPASRDAVLVVHERQRTEKRRTQPERDDAGINECVPHRSDYKNRDAR